MRGQLVLLMNVSREFCNDHPYPYAHDIRDGCFIIIIILKLLGFLKKRMICALKIKTNTTGQFPVTVWPIRSAQLLPKSPNLSLSDRWLMMMSSISSVNLLKPLKRYVCVEFLSLSFFANVEMTNYSSWGGLRLVFLWFFWGIMVGSPWITIASCDNQTKGRPRFKIDAYDLHWNWPIIYLPSSSKTWLPSSLSLSFSLSLNRPFCTSTNPFAIFLTILRKHTQGRWGKTDFFSLRMNGVIENWASL